MLRLTFGLAKTIPNETPHMANVGDFEIGPGKHLTNLTHPKRKQEV
jgi:hypothetical protein